MGKRVLCTLVEREVCVLLYMLYPLQTIFHHASCNRSANSIISFVILVFCHTKQNDLNDYVFANTVSQTLLLLWQ